MVIGKPCCSYACCGAASNRSFARAYARKRLCVGVDSVIGVCSTGLPYTEADEIATYCLVWGPRKADRSIRLGLVVREEVDDRVEGASLECADERRIVCYVAGDLLRRIRQLRVLAIGASVEHGDPHTGLDGEPHAGSADRADSPR